MLFCHSLHAKHDTVFSIIKQFQIPGLTISGGGDTVTKSIHDLVTAALYSIQGIHFPDLAAAREATVYRPHRPTRKKIEPTGCPGNG